MVESSIVERISENKDAFSKTEREIAEFLVSHLNESVIMTSQELAEKTSSSEATIIRFSKRLGYSGYQELKNSLKKMVAEKFSPSRRMELFYLKNDENNFNRFIDLQISYINEIKQKDFSQAASMISKARRIYLFTPGGATDAPYSTFMFWMTRFGLDVRSVPGSGHRIFDSLAFAGDDDLFFAFNFGKENRELIKLLAFCQEKKTPSILVTDFTVGVSADKAGHVIEVRRGPLEFFHSMSIPVLFTECLALEVAKHRGDVFMNMKKLEELRERFDV